MKMTKVQQIAAEFGYDLDSILKEIRCPVKDFADTEFTCAELLMNPASGSVAPRQDWEEESAQGVFPVEDLDSLIHVRYDQEQGCWVEVE